MTIDEAVEILEGEIICEGFDDDPKLLVAHQLGIEALKRLQKCRKAGYKFYCQLMPGETEE